MAYHYISYITYGDHPTLEWTEITKIAQIDSRTIRHGRLVPGIQANLYILLQRKLLPEVIFIMNVLIVILSIHSVRVEVFYFLCFELMQDMMVLHHNLWSYHKGRPESSNRECCGRRAVRWIWLHHTHLQFSISNFPADKRITFIFLLHSPWVVRLLCVFSLPFFHLKLSVCFARQPVSSGWAHDAPSNHQHVKPGFHQTTQQSS